MSLLNRVQQLPKGFVWGAATAAYQTEGSTKVAGKGKTMWDDYLVAQGRFLPDPASDFYNRYEEDIRLSAEHGLNAIRVSIAWTRIFPNGDDAEPLAEGVKHYHELFACCKKYGVEPYVSLHHFDSPAALFNQGDWLNRKTVDAYVRYAEFCFREFREVKNWFTINELISLSHSQYIQGNFPPNHHFDVTSGIQSQHNELVAHARAVNLYKDLDETEHLGGRIGMVNVLTPAYPATDSPADQHAADLYNAFYTDFIMQPSGITNMQTEALMLDTHEKRPLYLQLTDALLKQIVDEYQADDKLPTEMELCDEYAVSRATVRLAMSELERRGSIYRIQGKGSFVAPKRVSELNSLLDFDFASHCDGVDPDAITKHFGGLTSGRPISVMMLQQFGCQSRDEIQRLELTYELEGSFIGADTFFISKSRVPNNQLDFQAFSRIMDDLSKSIQSVRESYRARQLSDSEASNYGIAKLPVIELTHYAYDSGGKLISIVCRTVLTGRVPYQNFIFKS